jgi:hypothetical protein
VQVDLVDRKTLVDQLDLIQFLIQLLLLVVDMVRMEQQEELVDLVVVQDLVLILVV